MIKKLDSEISALQRKISSAKKWLTFNEKATNSALVLAMISGFIAGMLICINRFLELHGPAVTLRGYFFGWFLLLFDSIIFAGIFTFLTLFILSEHRRHLQKKLRKLTRDLQIAKVRKDRQLRQSPTVICIVPSIQR